MNNKVILAISAHEDDLDFGCSGTISKWINEGAKVYYFILTDGSKGSDDKSINEQELIKERQVEQENAAKVLGVEKVFFGNFEDGALEDNNIVRKEIVKMIRSIKPDIVITMDPEFLYNSEYGFINHPDHIAAARATMFSVYPFSRNRPSFKELLQEGLEPHKVSELLLISMGSAKANMYIDISSTIDNKIEALKMHTSQYDDFDKLKEMILKMSNIAGTKKGYQYAESFIRIEIKQ